VSSCVKVSRSLHIAVDVRTVAAIPACGIMAGSAAGLLLPSVPHAFAYALMVGAALGAVAALLTKRTWWLAGSVVVGFASGGTLLASDAWQHARQSSLRIAFDDVARVQRAEAVTAGRVVPEDPSAFAVVEGRLRADASSGPSGVSLSLAVDRIRAPAVDRLVSGGALITVAGSLAPSMTGEWRAGRRVRLTAELHRAARYLDEGVPDAEWALQMRGTSLLGSAKSGALVELLARAGWIDERMADVRALARRAIGDAVGRWSERSSSIVTAIVIGDRAGLDDDVERRLQEAGTYHVIAISGGNIAILAGLMIGGFRLMGLLGRAAMLASIVLLLAYGDLVGGGASVDRATFMAVVYLLARAADQRSPPLNALSCVAICLVAAEPLSVADPAFVLTFGATLAILLVASGAPWRRLPRPIAPLAALFIASVATEALLWPVGALFFSRVTFAGLALNFLAIPLMAVTQVAGMALVPAMLVARWISLASGLVAHLGAEGLVRSADLVSVAPAVTFRVAAPGWPVMVVYYVALVGWWRSRSGVPLMVAACAAVWMLAEPWTFNAARGDGRLHVTFLDVGQGDSAFIRLPRGATLLVDAGGLSGRPVLPAGPAATPSPSGFDIGDRVVAPPLRRAGVRRLDYLVLTHGDPDHVGGAASILREFKPHHVWEGIPVPRFEPLNALRGFAQVLDLDWANVTAGHQLTVDGVEITVEHPAAADWERQRVRNDDSVVLSLHWRDVFVLLTGDIGKDVERVLAPRIRPSPITVLKVPHHGSLTSSTTEFVRTLRPRVAVVSVGRANRFGHPVPIVLDRYRDAGAEIFRTDRDGAVTLDTDGYSLDIHTFNGRQASLGSRRGSVSSSQPATRVRVPRVSYRSSSVRTARLRPPSSRIAS
jgi:competence protein ComEC